MWKALQRIKICFLLFFLFALLQAGTKDMAEVVLDYKGRDAGLSSAPSWLSYYNSGKISKVKKLLDIDKKSQIYFVKEEAESLEIASTLAKAEAKSLLIKDKTQEAVTVQGLLFADDFWQKIQGCDKVFYRYFVLYYSIKP